MALSIGHPAPACSEQELVAAVRDGSDEAFEALYARYRPRIGAYIFNMVRDHARAEDLSQDVFFAALRRLRETKQPIAFKPWIYEIARNACIDEFRRSHRKREVPLEPESEQREGQRLALATSTPHQAIERKQSLDHLWGAFHGLSDSHWKVIAMRELEGRTYEEIAERMGLTRPMVESTLFRARRRLASEYGDLASGRRCRQVQLLIDTDGLRSLQKLGIRQRRQATRHLAHCQLCRRYARLAGVDESLLATPSLRRKLGGLLPLPWLRRRRGEDRRRDRHGGPRAGSGSHRLDSLQPIQALARYPEMLSSSGGFGRAVAALAAAVLAGGGGVLVSTAVSGAGAATGAAGAAGGHRTTAYRVPGSGGASGPSDAWHRSNAAAFVAATTGGRSSGGSGAARGTDSPGASGPGLRVSAGPVDVSASGLPGAGSVSSLPQVGGVDAAGTATSLLSAGTVKSPLPGSGSVSAPVSSVSQTVGSATHTVTSTVQSVTSTAGAVTSTVQSVTSTIQSVTATTPLPIGH